jgi:hypothetical protein
MIKGHQIYFDIMYLKVLLYSQTDKIVECVVLFLFSLGLIRLALWRDKNELIYQKYLAPIAT